MKFWQIFATIIIWSLANQLYERTNGLDGPATYVIFAMLVWALVSAVIWILSFYAFRAVDRPAERYENIETTRQVRDYDAQRAFRAQSGGVVGALETAATLETGPRNG